MSQGIFLSVYGKETPIEARVKRIGGNDVEVNGVFMKARFIYRRKSGVWFDEDSAPLDPILASFCEAMVAQMMRLVPS